MMSSSYYILIVSPSQCTKLFLVLTIQPHNFNYCSMGIVEVLTNTSPIQYATQLTYFAALEVSHHFENVRVFCTANQMFVCLRYVKWSNNKKNEDIEVEIVQPSHLRCKKRLIL